MIANIIKGSDFGGLTAYLFQPCDQSGAVRPEVVYLGGSVPGRTAPAIAASMGAIAALRPTVTKPVRHWMLSFAPEDQGKYDHGRMAEIGERFAREMGASAYAMWSHGDHIHIAANAVTHSAGYVPDTWDYAKAQTIMRRIECDHGLRELRSTHEVEPDPGGGKPRVVTVAPPDEARPTRGELNAAVGGQESHRLTLQALVASAAKGAPTLSQFIGRLEVAGVEPRVMVNKTGWVGISFGYQGTAFKGQDLGSKFKAKELQKAGVSYEQDRDREAVERCRSRPENRGHDGVAGQPAGGAPQGRADPGADGARDGRDAGADGEGHRTPGGGHVGSDGADARDHGEGNRSDVGNAEPDRAGEPAFRDVGILDGQGSQDARPGNRSPDGADGHEHSGRRAEDRESAEVVAEPGELVHRIVARDGAYSRVLGLAAADLLAESEGGRELADGVQRGQRAGLQRAAVGAFSVVASGRIRQQIAAMGVDQVEIGILPPKDRDDLRLLPLRRLTADEATEPKRVAFMAAMNAKGYDIYVRPSRAEGDNKGIVLVDDLDAEKVAAMAADGFEPSAIIQTSPGNLQAWVRVADHPLTADEGTAAAKALASRYGGDPGAADWCHFGRLAPFANRKAKHADPITGTGPLTEIKRAVALVASRGAQLVAGVRTWLADQAAQARREAEERTRQAEAARAAWQGMDRAERRQASPADAFAAFRGAVQTARPDDESARDYGAALRMFAAGYDAVQVAQAIRDASPGLADRKGRSLDGYVSRTVENAEADAGRRGWTAG